MDPVSDHRLDMARAWLACHGSVLLYGTQAVAESAFVDTLVDGIDGRRVLVCRREHTDPERRLGALAALLSSVDEAEVAAVPSAHRRLLAESIRNPPTAGATPSTAALGPAVLSLLRTLSRSTPLLLVVEAVHRLDHATLGVLEFVADKADGLPIHVIGMEQSPGPSAPQGLLICPSPPVMIRLGQPVGTPSWN